MQAKPSPTGRSSKNLALADAAMVLLCLTAMFWLLASPLVPIELTPSGLLIGTILTGVPLGLVGCALNHLAARSPARPVWPRDRQRRR